jgi:hypothetical protein
MNEVIMQPYLSQRFLEPWSEYSTEMVARGRINGTFGWALANTWGTR